MPTLDQNRYPQHVRIRHTHEGQALVLVAATLSLLVTLAVIGSDLSAMRRSVMRVNQAVDQSAYAGLRAIDSDSLAIGPPRLRPYEAEQAVRLMLAQQLASVSGHLRIPADVAATQAHVQVANPGEACWDGPSVQRPTVCVRLVYHIRSALRGEQAYVAQAQAEWTARP